MGLEISGKQYQIFLVSEILENILIFTKLVERKKQYIVYEYKYYSFHFWFM